MTRQTEPNQIELVASRATGNTTTHTQRVRRRFYCRSFDPTYRRTLLQVTPVRASESRLLTWLVPSGKLPVASTNLKQRGASTKRATAAAGASSSRTASLRAAAFKPTKLINKKFPGKINNSSSFDKDPFRAPSPPPIGFKDKPSPPSPRPSSDWRIPRLEPAQAPPYLAGTIQGQKKIQVIGLNEQLYRQRSVHRKQTRKARREFKKKNPGDFCATCKVTTLNKASTEAHLASRKHFLATAYKAFCAPCNFQPACEEDFQRHLNGKKHKKLVLHKSRSE